MKRLAIIGASGHGKVVADCAECSGWDYIDFFDDAWPKIKINGLWPIVGNTESLCDNLAKYNGVITAIGHNETRLKKQAELLAYGACIVTIVHPKACVSQYAKLGAGCVVMPGAIININANIGVACIVNTGATVDHDCTLNDGAHVGPGAHLAGGVIIEKNSWVGIGSSIRQLINVGENVVIGVGAAVVNDLKDKSVVVGVPAASLTSKK